MKHMEFLLWLSNQKDHWHKKGIGTIKIRKDKVDIKVGQGKKAWDITLDINDPKAIIGLINIITTCYHHGYNNGYLDGFDKGYYLGWEICKKKNHKMTNK